MATLRQLADPTSYRACDWDLARDAPGRAYWIEHFLQHIDVLRPLIITEYAPVDERRVDACLAAYTDTIRGLDAAGARGERLDVLLLDERRHAVLTTHDFADPFRHVKQRENALALAQLRPWLDRLAALDPPECLEQLAAGLMAGNVFDLGATATIERYRDGEHGFHDSLARLPRRPWFVDDIAAWRQRWLARPYRHVVWFVDNAGSDIILGCLPLARWMLARGARVTLAANIAPALNDVTASELPALLGEAAEIDGCFASDRLHVAATGNRAPLIDLTQLDREFVDVVADADLIMLHGMGRSIESNAAARFTCDATWSAVIKDEGVARFVGAKLFDCVFRFVESAGEPAADQS